jgi:tetratricopeptide (TPR) repeat protein
MSMQRKSLIIGAAVLVSVVVSWYILAQRHPEWSTDNPAALAEFELGQQAQAKVYWDEAKAHFDKASELDPDFVMARLFRLLANEKRTDADRTTAFSWLKKVDPSVLKPRERFLLGYYMSRFDKNDAGARQILASYLNEEPDDPFALNIHGQLQVSRQEWDAAERTFLRLTEVAPNRVEAYNQLGYLALARGRFDEGEKMFRTYMYLAPDQANPHDSLGELLALAGRYAEAREQFEQALRDKPDFCASYQHLLDASLLEGNASGVDVIVERTRAVGTCGDQMLLEMQCGSRIFSALLAHDWEAAWKVGLGACASSRAALDLPRYQAGARTGRLQEVSAWETTLRGELGKAGVSSNPVKEAVLDHMAGVRSLAEGKASEAATAFARADSLLTYRGLSEGGLFKLFNRQMWYEALMVSGQRDAAQSLLRDTRAVNAPFADLMAQRAGSS